MKILKKKKKT